MRIPKAHTLHMDTTLDAELQTWPPVYVAAMRLMVELYHAAQAVDKQAQASATTSGRPPQTTGTDQARTTFRSHARILCDVLSAGIGNVPSWTPAQDAALVGTSLETSRTTLPLTERFTSKVAPYMKARPKVYPAACIDEGSFIACVSLIMSRCFGTPGSPVMGSPSGDSSSVLSLPRSTPVLVPQADYFNHAYRQEDITARVSFDPATGDAIVTAVRPVPSPTRKAGMPSEPVQVYSTYGQLSDARLLYGYGFVIPPHGPGMESGRVEEIHWNVHNTVRVRGVDVIEGVLQGLLSQQDSAGKKKRGGHEAIPAVLKSTLEQLQAVGLWPVEDGGPTGLGAVILGHPAVQAAEQHMEALQAGSKKGKKRARPADTPDTVPLVPVELSTAIQVLCRSVPPVSSASSHGSSVKDKGYTDKYFDMLREAASAASSGQDVSKLCSELALPPLVLSLDADDKGAASGLLLETARVLRACLKRYPTSIDEDIEDVLEESDVTASDSDKVPPTSSRRPQTAGSVPVPVWPLTLPAADAHVTRSCRLVALGEKLLLQRYVQALAGLASVSR